MHECKVSAIICTYNRYELLHEAVQSLANQTLPTENFQIIIVDNSPDLGLSEEISRDYEEMQNLKWVKERTPGLSNARNVGLANADGCYIGFIDDDAVADRNWALRIAEAFDALEQDVAIIGGRVRPIWSVPRPSWFYEELENFLSVINWPAEGIRELRDGEWLAGTNIAYRADALRVIGGFSRSLGRVGGGHSLLSNEETDASARLVEIGRQARYVPDMIVDHLIEPNRVKQTWFRQRVAWQAVSDYLRDGKTSFENSKAFWDGVTWHFMNVPPAEKTPRGFFIPQDDPDKFKSQLASIYNMTMTMLSGFNGICRE